MTVVVVGGGLGGLACAHRLLSDTPGRDVLLLEASERLGGLVSTECLDGFVIERGPESMITTKPAGLALANELGLGPRLQRTRTSAAGAYVVTRGKLERIPPGFSIMAPTDRRALLRSPVLSPAGKLRALTDAVIPARIREDDSLASFVRRRFGTEVLERLAGRQFVPFVSLFSVSEGRLGVVVTFLALMELIKESLVEIVQTENFGPIHVKARSE